jgi:hypothetical protein
VKTDERGTVYGVEQFHTTAHSSAGDALARRVVVCRGGRRATTGRHLLDIADVDGRGGCAAGRHPPLDAVALAVSDIAGGRRWIAPGVLLPDQPALGVWTKVATIKLLCRPDKVRDAERI